ncbi:MAG: hypothetical protein WC130_11150 [Kiritimatiellia bacterium]|jgi:hypothetical protein
MSQSSTLMRLEDTEWFPQVPSRVREAVKLTASILERIDQAPVRARAFAEEAARMAGRRGFDEASLIRKYYRWVKSGRNMQSLVNKAMLPRRLQKNPVEFAYKKFCENNQRGSREAWREMIRQLCAGAELPGIGNWQAVWMREHAGERIPDGCPYALSNPPHGMTYSNLQHHHKLSKFEAKATRVGLKAARQFLLPVLTTRVGLAPGQYYQFDDMVHNAEVNFYGQPQGLRPREFVCYDVYSAMRVAYGIRPTVMDDDTGKKITLNEKEMRFLTVHILCDVGFHKDGCTFIVEHGTAAVKAAMEERIRHHAHQIQFCRSAILSDQVHDGMFPGPKAGNFRIKPLVEAAHALAQTVAAALPGQVGKDRNHYPERQVGASAYNKALIKAAMKLPYERARLLLSPLLHFDVYVSIVSELYERANDRDWHELEGWEKAGLVTSEYRLAVDGNWFPMDALLDMPAEQRAAIEAFLRARPEFMRVRKLSPREVWRRGQANLIRLPKYLVPDLLNREDGRIVKVQPNGTIVFEDRYLGPGRHIYYATVETPDKFQHALCREREYLVHITPYRPETAFISDKDSGAIIGCAPRYDLAPRYDQHAIEQLMGKQAHDMKLLADPIRERHADEAAAHEAMLRWNQDVLNGKPMTEKQRKEAKEQEDIMARADAALAELSEQ